MVTKTYALQRAKHTFHFAAIHQNGNGVKNESLLSPPPKKTNQAVKKGLIL
jgi:hypothetical protein